MGEATECVMPRSNVKGFLDGEGNFYVEICLKGFVLHCYEIMDNSELLSLYGEDTYALLMEDYLAFESTKLGLFQKP